MKLSKLMKNKMMTTVGIFGMLIVMTSSAQIKKDNWYEVNEHLFENVNSDHFKVFYIPDSLIEVNVNSLIEKREKSYKQISDFLNLKTDKKIDIYLFPSEQLKFNITGHRGYGWGIENRIVEVYNDSIQLDHYHELAHILIYEINEPPAMLDEGLAVYFSEKFGENSLVSLFGYPNKTINDVLRILRAKEEYISIHSLYKLKDISDAENVIMAYLQSASLVKYLVENFEKEKFLKLVSVSSKEDYQYNIHIYSEIYNHNLKILEVNWLNWLNSN